MARGQEDRNATYVSALRGRGSPTSGVSLSPGIMMNQGGGMTGGTAAGTPAWGSNFGHWNAAPTVASQPSFTAPGAAGSNPNGVGMSPGIMMNQMAGDPATQTNAPATTAFGSGQAPAAPTLYQSASDSPLSSPATMAGALNNTAPMSMPASDPIASQMPSSLGNDLNSPQFNGNGITPDAMGALMSPVPQSNSMTNPVAFGGLGGGR